VAAEQLISAPATIAGPINGLLTEKLFAAARSVQQRIAGLRAAPLRWPPEPVPRPGEQPGETQGRRICAVSCASDQCPPPRRLITLAADPARRHR